MALLRTGEDYDDAAVAGVERTRATVLDHRPEIRRRYDEGLDAMLRDVDEISHAAELAHDGPTGRRAIGRSARHAPAAMALDGARDLPCGLNRHGASSEYMPVQGAAADRMGSVSDYVQRSFESFMGDEYPRALAFARSTTGSWAEAEDLTQEAFLAAYRSWSDVAGYERPDAFVRKVIANQQVSRVRRRVREASALRRTSRKEATDTDVADPDFWSAVRQLPTRQRQVVALYYLEDRSIADIAVVLDIAEGTVKAHLHAARLTLARRLGDEIDEIEEGDA